MLTLLLPCNGGCGGGRGGDGGGVQSTLELKKYIFYNCSVGIQNYGKLEKEVHKKEAAISILYFCSKV